MDRAWIRRRLEQALEVRQQLDFHYGLRDGHKLRDDEVEYFDSIPPEDEVEFLMIRLEPTVLEIFRALDPESRYMRTEEDYSHTYTPVDRGNLERAVALAEDQLEWAVRLVPDAPSLVADHFHSWVWASAQPLWASGHYRMAVNAAAVAINARTQTKVSRRDVSDDDLMNQVFSTSPPQPGKPRLRIPGDHTDRTIQSRQRALGPFAQGCFAGIRNLAAHEDGPDWDEQRALQSLASLSILAGWIDECEVQYSEP